MRPVDRGEPPTDQEGREVAFANYGAARPLLIRRVGAYCSYCERPITHSPNVEHVLPKSLHPRIERTWTNLLLACDNCNRIKGRKPVRLHEYYWPDRDNTAWAISYDEDGSVQPLGALPAAQRECAQRTIDLTGLNRPTTDKDFRRLLRLEVWGCAKRALRNLRQADRVEMRRQIVDTARGIGFFSVWLTVFRGDTDMCRRFIEAFPGADARCFDDETGRPKPTIERPWIKEP